jgi:hypothetical protein
MDSRTHEAAVAILAATRDGDDLLPWQLKLVEDGVNDFLNDGGLRLLNQLLERTRAGTHRQWAIDQARREFFLGF